MGIEEMNEKIPIILSENVALKIAELTNDPNEWAGWLIGKKGDKELIVKDIILPPQVAGSADVEIGGAESDIWLLKNHLDKVDKIVGHIHCLTGDVPILLSDGTNITAKELYETKEVPKLVAYDYNDGFEFIKPTSIVKEYSNKILKIIAQGKEIKVTPNHRLMNDRGIWVESKKLKVGDKIMMLKSFENETKENLVLGNVSKLKMWKQTSEDNDFWYFKDRKHTIKLPKKITPKLAYLMGSLLSEGCLSDKKDSKNHLRGNISNNDVDFLKINQDIIKNLFGIEQRIIKKKTKLKNIKFEGDYYTNQLILSSSILCNFLHTNGFNIGRGIKRIPKIIMTSSMETKNSFLEGLIMGDGSIEKRGKKNIYKRVYSVYKELVSDLCYLLNSMGYKNLVRKTKQNFKNYNYSHIYDVYFQSIKQKRERRISDREYKNICKAKITSIEICEGEDVYSIEVPKQHNFVCGFGGFISHNSHNSMGARFSGGSDSGDRLNHKKLIESRRSLLFLVVAQSNKKSLLFEYEASYGFKYPSPLGTDFYIEFPAEIKIKKGEDNKELVKLRTIRNKIKEQLKLVDDKILEIINVERIKIKEEAEKIIKEQVKPHNIINVSYGDGYKQDLSSYTDYGKNSSQDLWVYEAEALTEIEIEAIKVAIKGSLELRYLIDVVKTNDYFNHGEKLFSIYIPCGKKKILASMTSLIENIVYGVDYKHEN